MFAGGSRKSNSSYIGRLQRAAASLAGSIAASALLSGTRRNQEEAARHLVEEYCPQQHTRNIDHFVDKRALRQMSGAASKLPFLKALVETESAARTEMIIRVAC
jgi:hypothetical protein